MYATIDTMLQRFGDSDLIEATDNEEPYTGQIVIAKLQAAMDMANSEVDAYLELKFAVPITNPPQIVVFLACDMARYHIGLAASRVTERDVKRYDAALKTLEKIASGTLKLPRLGADGGASNATPVQQPIAIHSNRPSVFGGGLGKSEGW